MAYRMNIIHSPPVLSVHLSLLFNSFLRHGLILVISNYCFGIILPLLKNKHGDASKLDMHRGITMSCSFSKLFESILYSVFDHWLTVDDLQYGFKTQHYSHALISFKESVKYCTRKGSIVRCVTLCLSLDASKAFDKVLHHGLFVELKNRGVPMVFIGYDFYVTDTNV